MKTVLSSLIILSLAVMLLVGCFPSKVTTRIANADNENANLYYYLPKGWLKITSKIKVHIYKKTDNHEIDDIQLVSQSFDVEPEIVPDTEQLLLLHYAKNIFRKDEIDIKINDRGLLTNVSATTKDKRLETIKDVVNTLYSEQYLSTGKYEVTEKEFTKTFIVNLDEDNPTEIKWEIPLIDAVENPNEKKLDVGFKVNRDNPPSAGAPLVLVDEKKGIKGIVSRAVSLYQFSIDPNNKNLQNDEVVYVYLPDIQRNITVPLTRIAFSKKRTYLSLADGLIKGNKISKPPASKKVAKECPNERHRCKGRCGSKSRIEDTNTKNSVHP